MNQYDTPLDQINLTGVPLNGRAMAKPVPEGMYLTEITEADIRTSKKGLDYVFVKFRILEGQYAGRDLTAFFFLWSEPNVNALTFYKRLRDACRLNADRGGHCEEFLGRRVLVKAAVKTNSSGIQENCVKSFKKASGVAEPARPMYSPWGD